MPPELLAPLTQFGTAGLIAWMWLTERRHAAARNEQLSEAHADLRRQRIELDQLLAVVAANTRAMTAVEASQHRLIELLEQRALAPTAPALRARG